MSENVERAVAAPGTAAAQPGTAAAQPGTAAAPPGTAPPDGVAVLSVQADDTSAHGARLRRRPTGAPPPLPHPITIGTTGGAGPRTWT